MKSTEQPERSLRRLIEEWVNSVVQFQKSLTTDEEVDKFEFGFLCHRGNLFREDRDLKLCSEREREELEELILNTLTHTLGECWECCTALREQVAYHEAGHAVAAYHFFGPASVVVLGLMPNPAFFEEHEGICSIRFEATTHPDEYVKQLMSGYLAESKYTGKSEINSFNSDRKKVKEFAKLSQKTWCRLRKETREFLDRPEIWSQVKSVAGALLEKPDWSLQGEEFRQILEGEENNG